MPDHILSRSLSPRRLLLAGLVVTVAACAPVPEATVNQAIEQPTDGHETPRLVGARGPLTAEQSKAVLAKLQSQAPDSDILARHLAIEQAVAETPLVVGNSTELLRDGAQAFHAMFAAIRKARKHVHLEYYIVQDIEDDGEHLSDLLIRKRQEGVQVALIYDSYGSDDTPAAFFDRLKAGGVQLVSFNSLNPLQASASPNDRDHRKILIVDGNLAIVGGVNLSTDYESSGSAGKSKGGTAAPPQYWRDTDMEIVGPAVAQLQKLFLATWSQQKGPPLDDAGFFPTIPPNGPEVVRIIGSGHDDKVPRYYATLLSAIRSAEQSVWLSTAYFVPTSQEVEDLKAAARRGVDVRLLLPGKSDSSLALAVGHSHYSELLEAGVKIFEAHDAILHSKAAMIDGVWSTVGSSNFDHRSVLFNDEVDAVVLGHATAGALQQLLDAEMHEAVAINAETWSHRSLGERIEERLGPIWQNLL